MKHSSFLTTFMQKETPFYVKNEFKFIVLAQKTLRQRTCQRQSGFVPAAAHCSTGGPEAPLSLSASDSGANPVEAKGNIIIALLITLVFLSPLQAFLPHVWQRGRKLHNLKLHSTHEGGLRVESRACVSLQPCNNYRNMSNKNTITLLLELFGRDREALRGIRRPSPRPCLLPIKKCEKNSLIMCVSLQRLKHMGDMSLCCRPAETKTK